MHVFRGVLAGVLHGLEAAQEPPPPVVGNAYAKVDPDLPLTWEAAIAAFAADPVLPEYLGSRFCGLYLAGRGAERRRFAARVTPTEHEWYLAAV